MSKNYLKEDQNRRLEVLESLGVKEDDIKRDIEILRNWAEKEKHLPQDFINDELFLERLLLNNKFRIEQSKIKYDNYFTMKAEYNFFYQGIEKVIPSSIPVVKFPLRKLTNEGKRVILICVSNHGQTVGADFEECLKFQVAVSEIMNKYSFTDSRIAIIDVYGLKSGFFKNFDVSMLHKHLKLIRNCYSGRVAAIHMVNLTNFANLLLGGIKMIFKDVASKIKVHENLESLHREVPRAILPKDYGGDDIPVAEYLKIWNDIIKEEEIFLKNLRYQVADESLRIGFSNLKSDEFGVDGTFKQLNID
ncbi:alpha-tocopherol transfer protein-like [Coccinella septempunctata]|uniref:alpha-tocopherol transfer protein-like n=1 Tax=Coccinella septempunctata TaxID=41139 RepID=UPI001D05C7A2|nr:alpha-tocopherol transfer protein-like [Coccinella septempunctata]